MTVYRTLVALLIAMTLNTVAQHDPGRNAVRLLAKGEVDKALVAVAKTPPKRNSPISDGERNFVLAMAACIKGDAAVAYDYAKKAAMAGLPTERLVVGPREVLKPLYDHAPFKEWIASKPLQPIHGPMLGSVTDTSARFWVRTAEEAEVTVLVYPKLPKGVKRAARPPLKGTAKTSAATDYTAVVTISGLSPSSNYRYDMRAEDKLIVRSVEFRTQPKAGEGAKFSIAFGGGAGLTPQKERMWTTIGKHDVSALLLLGDNVYIDDPTHQVTNQYCYYRRQSQPEWRSLVSRVGVYTIYDDHDFGTNDCVPGPEIETPTWKREVWKTFSNNWANPSYGGGAKQPGCWYDFSIGDVHFIMLDCRYYRDLKGESMLGPVQKKWLLETLKSSKGKFKVLASSVPWSPGVKGGSKDTWDGFKKEREEIFSYIETQRVNGVVLMAADRHRSDLRKIKRPKGYDLYEVMSSRLTNMHVHGLVQNAKGSEFIMGYNKDCSFGLMEFDTTAADPTVKYTIIDIDNKPIDSRTLKLSQLSFK